MPFWQLLLVEAPGYRMREAPGSEAGYGDETAKRK